MIRLPRHRGVRVGLAVVTVVLAAQLVYLAYANLKLPTTIASLAEQAGIKATYSRAYSLYPGHASVSDLKLSGVAPTTWTVSLPKLEVRPMSSDGGWVTRVVIPAQEIKTQLGKRSASANAHGELRLTDVMFSQSAAKLVGGFVEARKLVIHLPPSTSIKSKSLEIAAARLTLPSRASTANDGSWSLQGDISGQGADAGDTLEAL